MNDRLYRRPFLIQFIFDNWIYIAIGIFIWQLPHLLENFYDDPLSGFDSSAELTRYIRRNGPNEAINRLGLFNGFFILAILAMSYNLAFGFSGIISFGHALFFGAATYTIIVLVEDYTLSLERSTAGALLFGVLFGLILSLVVLRIKGVYFAMFTLAMSEMFFELSTISVFKFLTEGEDGRQFVNNRPTLAAPYARLELYEVTAMCAIGVFVLIKVLMASRIGKVILAIRENEERAKTMGYNVALYKTLVLVLSCTIAALAGVLYSLDAGSASPTTTLGVGRTIEPLLMTIIGGTGTIFGPVMGTIIWHFGEDIFRSPELHIDLNFIIFRYQDTVDTVSVWPVVLGVMFILIVLVIPFGIVGQINKLWNDSRRWQRTYFYDPIVRNNPKIASYFKMITGESPELAQAIAARSKDKTLLAWIQNYPIQGYSSAVIVLAIVAGLFTGSHQTGTSVFLFLMLIASPLIIGYTVYANREAILGQWEKLRSTFS